jgi:hypothetical protein
MRSDVAPQYLDTLTRFPQDAVDLTPVFLSSKRSVWLSERVSSWRFKIKIT